VGEAGSHSEASRVLEEMHQPIEVAVSDLTPTLPEPSGVVPIRLSGGAAKASIRRPAGVEEPQALPGRGGDPGRRH
jgi:hypothetical protein